MYFEGLIQISGKFQKSSKNARIWRIQDLFMTILGSSDLPKTLYSQ